MVKAETMYSEMLEDINDQKFLRKIIPEPNNFTSILYKRSKIDNKSSKNLL